MAWRPFLIAAHIPQLTEKQVALDEEATPRNGL